MSAISGKSFKKKRQRTLFSKMIVYENSYARTRIGYRTHQFCCPISYAFVHHILRMRAPILCSILLEVVFYGELSFMICIVKENPLQREKGHKVRCMRSHSLVYWSHFESAYVAMYRSFYIRWRIE